MRVLLTGATGFVGQYVAAALQAQGHEVVALVRPGHRARLAPLAAGAIVVYGDITEAQTLEAALSGCQAVINLVGILREHPLRGITYGRVHVQGTRNLLAVARAAGVKRFVQISANGARPEGNPYQVSKYEAEQLLRASGLDWTIFRPSVIVGDSFGRTSFLNEIASVLRLMPAFPLPGEGECQLQPVHVRDLAEACVRSLEHPDTIRQVYAVGGPEQLSCRVLVDRIARALGKTWLLLLPTPLALVRLAVDLGENLPGFPLGSGGLALLLEGNTCEDNRWGRVFGITPMVCDGAAFNHLRERG